METASHVAAGPCGVREGAGGGGGSWPDGAETAGARSGGGEGEVRSRTSY